MFTESLLRNGFGHPYYTMYMFYSVQNKPLSSQCVLFIYSTKVRYPRIKRVLEIIDNYFPSLQMLSGIGHAVSSA
jgi:hypothetical protein